MYRILVVDDEAFITDSLAFLLENQNMAELEVARAYSAAEALSLLNHSAFQIVISDIEMPGKSGLDLLREIHAKWPSCKVVFLSGHDDFQYAHQAMRYNAVRYVLKNEGDDVLLEAVAECIRRIDREKERAGDVVKTGEERVLDGIHRQSLRRCLTEPEKAQICTPGEWKRLGIRLDTGRKIMLMAGCTRESIYENNLQSIQAIVQSKIGHAVVSDAIWLHKKLGIWLMQPADVENRDHALAAIKGLAEEICEACRTGFHIHVTFIFNEEEVRFADIPQHVRALQDVAQNRLNKDSGIAMAGFRFFEQQDGKQEEPATEAVFVCRVMSHIRENLGSDLSLSALSELVYLNPSYLSRRFKEVTGQNLTDTILRLRMEEACRQLEETTNRVKNIAVQVGYESAAHFSRIFKREKGMTPQEYRDRFIR